MWSGMRNGGAEGAVFGAGGGMNAGLAPGGKVNSDGDGRLPKTGKSDAIVVCVHEETMAERVMDELKPGNSLEDLEKEFGRGARAKSYF